MLFSSSLCGLALAASAVYAAGIYERDDPYGYLSTMSPPSNTTNHVAVAPPDATGDVDYVANAFYANYHMKNFTVDDLEWTKLTSVTYGFIPVPTDSFDNIVLSLADTEGIAKVVKKAKQYNITAVVSLGGHIRGGSAGFALALDTEQTRTDFVSGVVQLVNETSVNGVEFDWEYTECSQDTPYTNKTLSTAYLLFLVELREALGQNKTISLATGPLPFETPQIAVDDDTTTWDDTSSTSSWDDATSTASWDAASSTASWDDASSTASWDDTSSTDSWESASSTASWDSASSESAYSATGTSSSDWAAETTTSVAAKATPATLVVGKKFIDTPLDETRIIDGSSGNSSTASTTFAGDLRNVTAFSNVVDYFNLMAFDFSGPWSSAGVVQPNAPLNGSCSSTSADALHVSVASAVASWSLSGVRIDQIVLGVSASGRSYFVPTGSALTKNGMNLNTAPHFTSSNGTNSTSTLGDSWWFSPEYNATANYNVTGSCNDTTELSTSSGVFTFHGLVEAGFLRSDGKPSDKAKIISKWDDCSKTAFVYNKNTEVLVSYDNAEALTAKGEFILNGGLRGFSLWEAGADSKSILLDAIRTGAGFDDDEKCADDEQTTWTAVEHDDWDWIDIMEESTLTPKFR